MEVYGSVIWRIEMSERLLVWSACCVYGPAKSIHSSSQPLMDDEDADGDNDDDDHRDGQQAHT